MHIFVCIEVVVFEIKLQRKKEVVYETYVNRNTRHCVSRRNDGRVKNREHIRYQIHQHNSTFSSTYGHLCGITSFSQEHPVVCIQVNH